MQPPRVLIVMGVAGAGKSTVAKALAERHGGEFFDADDWHPEANLWKLEAGIPLTDEDRAPWLERMRREIIDPAAVGKLTVLACSALKRDYRRRLGVGVGVGVGEGSVRLLYLRGAPELLLERLEQRQNHVMKSAMLASQLATLEEPDEGENAVVLDVSEPPEWIVAEAARAFGLADPG
jgi:gluconokinase